MNTVLVLVALFGMYYIVGFYAVISTTIREYKESVKKCGLSEATCTATRRTMFLCRMLTFVKNLSILYLAIFIIHLGGYLR